MLMIFTTVFGFLGPLLPEVIKWFNRRQENAHELAMLEAQAKLNAQEHQARLAEISAAADIAIEQAVHQPQQSFGVQLLDAAKSANLPAWVFVPAFWLFAVLDFVTGLVRPVMAYTMLGFYYAMKWAQYTVAKSYSTTPAEAVIGVWTTDDMALLLGVVSFYVGGRVAKTAFGGSTLNDKRT